MSVETYQLAQCTTLRGRVLADAILATEGERNSTYGDPKENLQTTACLWQTYLVAKYKDDPGDGLKAEDVAIMMALLKIARLAVTPELS